MKNQALYVLSSMILMLAGCNQTQTSKKEKVEQAAIPVSIEEVKTTSVKNDISVSGNIEGNTTVRLGFLVAGKVNFIGAKEGQTVKKGQILASLDPTSYNIAKQLSEVQVNAVTDEFNRLKLLHDKGSVTESDFSKVNFTLQQAKLQQQLQAKNEGDTKLYSPISGVLLKKLTEVGEIVGTGIPCFVISDISKVKVLAYIPEGELQYIKIGQKAAITISALDRTFTGKVVEVGSAADVTSRAFTIKIEVDNPNQVIRPGMIAEAKIGVNNAQQATLLPAECINHDINNLTYVFVVEKASNKAFKREVSLGKMIENKIEILTGLNAGEWVVVAGQNKISDGSAVTIK
ncbi:efflux transporter, RND family, MFP subunit [Emticicia oligotrophica DSM 17448]|uniref:Efflux transporter, RND family, MFP subunit n=1 Tax=Emticicia oligotrophica (strain DSM 17448 / CIP 109782 / MTCC 6937 / GPTSA100-15) TaxID=929562 RepID=A0ABM5N3A9_EMTOG|nr:efflux RND transporter periplasmic adaptor subunit [Emticicia oligotrophica]AFK03869.1 efflux transporter, RND family, MFP subunit [Emticicia oligotrophica DSM 17448]